MQRILAIFTLSSSVLLAQFIQFATTDTGDQLYFSSTLRLKGLAPTSSEHRIYHINETGSVELFAERGELTPSNGGSSSGDGARFPQVSGDGRTVAWTLQNICEPGESCLPTTKSQAEIRGRYNAVLGSGSVYLSRNARWGLFAPPLSSISDPAPDGTPH